MTYRAEASPPSVAVVAVSGSAVTVLPVSAGAATVAVTAEDTGGLTATQRFEVSVAPVPTRIDVGVYYTPAARRGISGDAEAFVDLLIAESNAAFERSGAHVRLHLVDRRELRFTENAGTVANLDDFMRGRNGLEAVPALRDAAGADLMVLLGDWAQHRGPCLRGGGFTRARDACPCGCRLRLWKRHVRPSD